MEKLKILYISQEMDPFMSNENEITSISRYLPQGIMEQDAEIRAFMPRFGTINERRHQLHEVIRLSGMNLIINDTDQPLIIKVASIPVIRMQVYFIDNEEFFKRKATLTDETGKFFKDNDERAIFYIRGVFETVKKLGWAPDIIHCSGWMTSLASTYLRSVYKDDPMFMNAKLVQSLYKSDEFTGKLNKNFADKVLTGDMTKDDFAMQEPNYINLMKDSIAKADAVVYGNDKVNEELLATVEENNTPHLRFNPEEDYVQDIMSFYEELVDESVLAE